MIVVFLLCSCNFLVKNLLRKKLSTALQNILLFKSYYLCLNSNFNLNAAIYIPSIVMSLTS